MTRRMAMFTVFCIVCGTTVALLQRDGWPQPDPTTQCRYDWEAVGYVDDACDLPGRWVFVGPWDGLMRCESKPSRLPALAPPGTPEARSEVRVDQTGSAGERTGFQFLPSTWVSMHLPWERDRPVLIERDPYTLTLAQQLKAAEWLRSNVGIYQWSCGDHYGTGDGWVYVTGEHHLPKRRKRCARRLHDFYGFTWKISRSVCGRPIQ